MDRGPNMMHTEESCPYRADAEHWRAAEAEGHVVDFTEDGYGLQHPPSCRPNLIECEFNEYLAAGCPDVYPGRYSMGRKTDGTWVYAAIERTS
jgi:hypothetical protein